MLLVRLAWLPALAWTRPLLWAPHPETQHNVVSITFPLLPRGWLLSIAHMLLLSARMELAVPVLVQILALIIAISSA
jgi:hypothetical protein